MMMMLMMGVVEDVVFRMDQSNECLIDMNTVLMDSETICSSGLPTIQSIDCKRPGWVSGLVEQSSGQSRLKSKYNFRKCVWNVGAC
jgi:hypothetical protein